MSAGKPQQLPNQKPQQQQAATGVPTTPAATPPRPTAAAYKRPVRVAEIKKEYTFLFDKENYIWMIGGVALIFIGFLLMSGGKSPDPHKFNYEEIFSFRRITLAPIVVLLGFAVEVYAIMKKPKETVAANPQGQP